MQRDPWKLLQARMEIRKRREMVTGEQATPDEAPLSQQESLAFNAIINHLLAHSAEPTQIKKSLESMSEGQKRYMLNMYVEPTLIKGVPYQWFVANAVISMLIFISMQNFTLLLITAPVIHLAGYIYYRMNGKRMREEKMNLILTEGIK